MATLLSNKNLCHSGTDKKLNAKNDSDIVLDYCYIYGKMTKLQWNVEKFE
jgi:hypothetical protein